MRVQSIIFDLGQTLIPFALEPIHARVGSDPGTRAAVQTLMVRFERGELDGEEFQTAMCKMAQLGEGEFLPWWNSIFEPRFLIPETWIRELLGRYRCGVLSNTNVTHFAYLQEAYPLLGAFAFRILSHEAGAVKPEARIYEAAEAAAQCPPGAILYFDDVAQFVAAAGARGWQAHQFHGPETVLEALPELRTV
ncbi:MAG: HAD family hydrolase [Terriglobales bacterium]